MGVQADSGIYSLEDPEFTDYYFSDVKSINDFSNMDSTADYYFVDVESISHFSGVDSMADDYAVNIFLMWTPWLIIMLLM